MQFLPGFGVASSSLPHHASDVKIRLDEGKRGNAGICATFMCSQQTALSIPYVCIFTLAYGAITRRTYEWSRLFTQALCFPNYTTQYGYQEAFQQVAMFAKARFCRYLI